MTLTQIKEYLNGRPFTPVLPVDTQLTKYMDFAILIIKTFYDVNEEFFNDEDAIAVVGEQISYLLQNNPTEDVYKMYNYLKKFSVAGAISGEVIDKSIGFLAPFTKNLMSALAFQMIQSDSGKSYYTYSLI